MDLSIALMHVVGLFRVRGAGTAQNRLIEAFTRHSPEVGIVAKRMGTYVLLQTSALAGLSDGIADCIPRERLVGILSGEHPFPGPYFPPIATQQFQELGGQLNIAALVASDVAKSFVSRIGYGIRSGFRCSCSVGGGMSGTIIGN